jgi:hypothetical protein
MKLKSSTKRYISHCTGKALTIDSASSEPWYVYVGGMALLALLLKIAGDVASGVIESLESEGGEGDS